jgi:hypothetical protein
MRRFIYLAFILLASCSPKPTELNGSGSTTPKTETIIGKWNWVRTSGGFAGQIIYPKPMESQTYQFTSDSIAYYVHRYADTMDNWNSRFSLRDQRSFITGAIKPFLYFNDTVRIRSILQSVWFHGYDTLELLDEAADGYSYLFVRQ